MRIQRRGAQELRFRLPADLNRGLRMVAALHDCNRQKWLAKLIRESCDSELGPHWDYWRKQRAAQEISDHSSIP